MIGAEATGITNFSGGGGGPSMPIPMPTGGGGGGPQVINIPQSPAQRAPEQAGNAPSPAILDSIMGLQQQQSRIAQRLSNRTQQVRDTTQTTTERAKDVTVDRYDGPIPTIPGADKQPPPQQQTDRLSSTEFAKQRLARQTGPVGTAASTGMVLKSGIGSPATEIGDKPAEGTLFGGVYSAGESFGEATQQTKQTVEAGYESAERETKETLGSVYDAGFNLGEWMKGN